MTPILVLGVRGAFTVSYVGGWHLKQFRPAAKRAIKLRCRVGLKFMDFTVWSHHTGSAVCKRAFYPQFVRLIKMDVKLRLYISFCTKNYYPSIQMRCCILNKGSVRFVACSEEGKSIFKQHVQTHFASNAFQCTFLLLKSFFFCVQKDIDATGRLITRHTESETSNKDITISCRH